MGFVRTNTIKLTWADESEFHGLEVRMRRPNVGQFLDLAPLIDGQFDMLDPADRQTLKDLFAEFGKILIDWNLEEEAEGGQRVPIPCTVEEFLRQDPALVREVVQQWARSSSGAPGPLEQPSPDGDSSLEASLPMEVLSPSLAS